MQANEGDGGHAKTAHGRRRANPPVGPHPDSLVKISFWERFNFYRDLLFWLDYKKTLSQLKPTTWVLWLIFAAAIGLSARFVAAIAGVWPLDGVAGEPFAVSFADRRPRLFFAFSAVALVTAWYSFWKAQWRVRRWLLRQNAITNSNWPPIQLDGDHAGEIGQQAVGSIKQHFAERKWRRIESLNADRETPYRVILGAALVPFGYPRAPEDEFELQQVDHPATDNRRSDALDIVDALAAGVLRLLGSKPLARFSARGGALVATNRYWRPDRQELPDNPQGDIFLRFHQSTVERTFPPMPDGDSVCTYKTFVAVNNFRRTSILLLRVKDVVERLRTDPEVIGVWGHGTGDDLIKKLGEPHFTKEAPRVAYYRQAAAGSAIDAPILLFDSDDGEPIMSFDPGRVWDGKSDATRSRHAVMALRVAIHNASCDSAIAVTLRKQDVLVVDNLRMLIGRREDDPTSILPWRDMVAAAWPPLRGRWLRQLYGFLTPDVTAMQNEMRIDASTRSAESCDRHSDSTRASDRRTEPASSSANERQSENFAN
ncbi:MAG: hypothetical protein GC152_02805 [Alphaproteobacteria bacterium]|nr:hypothetical protein [Alphaproteobacteria bacterium]